MHLRWRALSSAQGCLHCGFGRHHRHEARLLRQLARGVVLIGAVHEQRHLAGVLMAHCLDELASFGRVTCLARRQAPSEDIAGRRGNQMKLGAPAAAAAADGLRAVFFGAPVPSGCTVMMVESRLRASMRTCIRR